MSASPNNKPIRHAMRAYLAQQEDGAHITVYFLRGISNTLARKYMDQFGHTELIMGNSISIKVDPLYNANDVLDHLNSFGITDIPLAWQGRGSDS